MAALPTAQVIQVSNNSATWINSKLNLVHIIIFNILEPHFVNFKHIAMGIFCNFLKADS